MRRSSARKPALALAAFALGLGAAMLLLREPMEPLTREGLDRAWARWRSAGVEDYDMRFRMHGNLYDIRVRSGIVVEATINGQPPMSTDLQAYSVDGLLETIELEVENIADPHGPFPRGGASVIARVKFHDKLGYVERYLRNGAGLGRPATIETLEFRQLAD